VTIGGHSISALLSALRNGDREALSILYTGLFGMLWSLASVQTHSRETAQDVVQDVFLWLWNHREKLRPDTDIRVYLAVAVRNRARNLRRHEALVDATAQAVIEERTDIPAAGQPASPVDHAIQSQEFHAAYQRALTILDERERTAALLRWEEDFTLQQIAEVLAISVVGARGVLMRAQRKVQSGLEDYRR
jgi:RNA polymerase sigma-70 factor (ECF subfamily)